MNRKHSDTSSYASYASASSPRLSYNMEAAPLLHRIDEQKLDIEPAIEHPRYVCVCVGVDNGWNESVYMWCRGRQWMERECVNGVGLTNWIDT